MREQDRCLKDVQSKVATHDEMLNKINAVLKEINARMMPGPMKGLVKVRKHYELSEQSRILVNPITTGEA
ncbi:hypothetical protein Tco_0028248 [Tanacetum coccineum]